MCGEHSGDPVALAILPAADRVTAAKLRGVLGVPDLRQHREEQHRVEFGEILREGVVV